MKYREVFTSSVEELDEFFLPKEKEEVVVEEKVEEIVEEEKDELVFSKYPHYDI